MKTLHHTDRLNVCEPIGPPIQSNQFYAYLWIREKNGKFPAGTPYYVGKGKGRRAFSNHKGGLRPPVNTSCIVVMPRSSEQEAYDSEKELIRNWGRLDIGTGCLRNHTDGGEGGTTLGFLGHRHTEESKLKISSSKEGCLGTRLGVVVSQETQKKMSIARMGRVPTNKGKKYSPELRQQMSSAQRKRFETESAWNKGKAWSPSARLKMSIAARKRWEKVNGK